MEDLYKNVKGLDLNSHKLYNMFLCLSNLLGVSLDNGSEYAKKNFS